LPENKKEKGRRQEKGASIKEVTSLLY
jgi:hypothetical protein